MHYRVVETTQDTDDEPLGSTAVNTVVDCRSYLESECRRLSSKTRDR
jgi:hypothetical protein